MGDVLRERRRQLALTLEQVSRKAGISIAFLSMLESGDRRPSLEVMVKLAEALELDYNTIIRNWSEW